MGEEKSKLSYLKDKSILALVNTQFFSALGDVGFRTLVAAVIMVPGLSEEKTVVPLALAQIAFMLPYVLTAPWVGTLSDMFSKKYILSLTSGLRGLFLAAVFFLYIPNPEHHLILYLAIAFTGTLAAAYSPAKYGIIPELTPAKGLVVINGVVEAGTLSAILLGKVGLGALIDFVDLWPAVTPGQPLPDINASSFMICVAAVAGAFVVSCVVAFLIPKDPPYAASASEQPALTLKDYMTGLKEVFTYPPLRKAILGVCLFWTVSAGLNVLFYPFGQKYLGLTSWTAKTGLYLALVGGIILGSSAIGFFKGADRLSYTRFCAWGMGGCLILFSFMRSPFWGYASLVLTGAVAGMFLIPLNAAIQRHSKRELTARVIATSNLLNNVTMILVSGILMGITLVANPAMFSLPADLGEKLNNQKIPSALKEKFEESKVNFSDKVRVELIKKDKSWEIYDPQKKLTFSLKKEKVDEKDQIRVYKLRHIILWMLIAVAISMILMGGFYNWKEEELEVADETTPLVADESESSREGESKSEDSGGEKDSDESDEGEKP